jgi:hypothetical protein
MSCVVVLTFGLGTLSQLLEPDSLNDIPPWMYRRWVVRMTGVIALALVAAVTSWGMSRQRSWGRRALTVVTTLPIPVLLCGWLLLNHTDNPGLRRSLDPAGLTALSVLSVISCPLLLFLVRPITGRTGLPPGCRDKSRETPSARPGCGGIASALAIVLAALASYFVLLLTFLSILAVLGVIRSI